MVNGVRQKLAFLVGGLVALVIAGSALSYYFVFGVCVDDAT